MSLSRRGRKAAGSAVLVLAFCACSEPVPIPEADLSGVEPQIAEAVTRARAVVEENPGSADAWGALGDRYFVHEWFEQAAECYRHAEALDPGQFVWVYRRGLCLGSTSNLEQATDVLARAIQLRPDYAPAHDAYAGNLTRIGRIDEAEEHYRIATRINPRLSHPRVGLGQIAFGAGDMEEARQHLEEALWRNPNHGEAHHTLAQVLMALGDEWRAAYHADRARELPRVTARPDPAGVPDVEPAGSAAHTARGIRLEQDGNLEEAERHYQEAVRANAEYMPAHYSLGRLLARTGRYEEAVGYLEEAVRLKSTDRGARRELSLVLRRLSRFEEAERHLRTILDDDPTHAPAHHDLGTMLARSGRLEEGIDHLARAVELQPGNLDARMNLALAVLENGELDRADTLARAILSVDPHHARAQVALADTTLARGKTADAVAGYREALRLKPGWSLPAQRLAWIFATDDREEFRNPEEAIRLASLAVEGTARGDALALDTLAAAYAETGRFEDALARANEALALASSSDDTTLAGAIRERIAGYENRRPHRE